MTGCHHLSFVTHLSLVTDCHHGDGFINFITGTFHKCQANLFMKIMRFYYTCVVLIIYILLNWLIFRVRYVTLKLVHFVIKLGWHSVELKSNSHKCIRSKGFQCNDLFNWHKSKFYIPLILWGILDFFFFRKDWKLTNLNWKTQTDMFKSITQDMPTHAPIKLI